VLLIAYAVGAVFLPWDDSLLHVCLDTKEVTWPLSLFLVRPAWALSCGCKSRREETILIEAKPQLRKGDRAWGGSGERNCGLSYTNPIRGGAKWGEQAKDCEAPMVKTWRRKSGNRAVKDSVLTWGDLALYPKG